MQSDNLKASVDIFSKNQQSAFTLNPAAAKLHGNKGLTAHRAQSIPFSVNAKGGEIGKSYFGNLGRRTDGGVGTVMTAAMPKSNGFDLRGTAMQLKDGDFSMTPAQPADISFNRLNDTLNQSANPGATSKNKNSSRHSIPMMSMFQRRSSIAMNAAATTTNPSVEIEIETAQPTVTGGKIDSSELDQDYMDYMMDKQKQLQVYTKLGVEEADAMVNNAIACGQRNGFNPFAVSVVDAAGNTIVHKVMDGCSMVGIPEFATAKAYSCIVTKMSSRQFRDKYTGDKNPGRFCQMTSMIGITGDKMMPCPGGTLIKDQNGQVIGAIGVSGASADEDEYCGMVGVIETNPNYIIDPMEDSCETKKDSLTIEDKKKELDVLWKQYNKDVENGIPVPQNQFKVPEGYTLVPTPTPSGDVKIDLDKFLMAIS